MNRLYFSKLVILIAMLLGCNAGAFAQTPTVFSVNNATGNSSNPYTYTVPTGCTVIAVDMVGAIGGNEVYQGYGVPGLGGRVQCQVAVTAGQILYCYVGGKGLNSLGCCGGGVVGGYNGGGASQEYYAASGGGGSDISLNSGTITARNRIVVAGGGGGGAYGCCCSSTLGQGGPGGGLSGGGGYMCGSQTYSTCYNASGGTQTGGGNPGSCGCSATAGSLGVGGNGATCYYGGGGGGGYYGGGGAYGGGGGGGSSYTNPAYCSVVTNSQGYWNTGDGYISITPLVPTITITPGSLSFGPVTVGTLSIPQYFTISGVRLVPTSGNDTIWAPAAGYQISLDGITWVTTYLIIPYSGGVIPTTNVYVQFMPTLPISYCGFPVTITGGSAPGLVNLCGTGANLCSGTPTTGTASITPTTGGGGTPFSLNLTGGTVAGGLVYDWQSSPTGTGGWVDIPSGVTQTFNFTGISATTRYRAIVTCPSYPSATSNTVTATYAGVAGAGCTVTTLSICTGCGFFVGNGSANPFVIKGEAGTSINDASAAAPPYHDFTLTQVVNMVAGGNYTGTDGATANNSMAMQIWIDFNNDGTFQTSESVGGANWTSGTIMPNVPIAIPTTVALGSYRMRVMIDYNCCGGTGYPSYPSLNPCGTSMQYVDARDYTVNIGPAGCSGTPSAGITYPSLTTACNPYTSTVYNVGATVASGMTYNWQTSSDGLSWSNIPGATNAVYTQAVTGNVWLRDLVTCTVSSSSVMSPIVALTLNATPAAITGITNICTALPQTLTETTTGGIWSSSNIAIANVGTAGIVTGTGAGTSTISYTVPTGCAATTTVTVNLSPAAITGTPSVCTGLTTTLTDATALGAWSSSDVTLATVSGGVVTGVASTGINPTITYTLPSGCTAVKTVTVNQMPAAITGTPNVCIGSTTVLADSKPGGTWISNNSFHASVDPVTGLVTGIVASTPTISYTLPGGCTVTQPVTVNSLPGTISGAPTVCVGSKTTWTDGGTGTWTSSNPSVATVVSGTGVVTGVASGSATITYTLTATGCMITAPITVINQPTLYTVTGGGGFCAGGSGAHVGLSGSDLGINYQLINSTVGNEALVSGSHSGLDFGSFTDVGNYFVVATDAAHGCTDTMTGTKSITVNPLPAIETVGGGGTYCAGGTGVQITVTPSESGVNYQAYNGIVPMGSAVPGTGGSGTLNLGLQTAASSGYTVIATNAATLCTSTMSGTSLPVATNPLPAAFTVMTPGSPAYCAGTGGVDIQLSGSQLSTTYNLYRGTTFIKSMTGTGSGFSFGMFTTVGCYTVVAADPIYGCTANMTGSVCVTINPLPTAQIMTGGGSYCAGGTGVHVGLNFSVTATKYILWYNGAPTADTVNGSNSGLDFGLQTNGGTYQVVAMNTFGCTNNMLGMETVSVNPLPNAYPISADGNYCSGTSGFDVMLTSGSDLGVNYSLYKNNTTLVATKPGTTSPVDFGNQLNGSYTIMAVNGTTGCSAPMPGTAHIGINSLPTVYPLTGGGHYCFGGAGADIMLNKSDIGTLYKLYQGTTYINGISSTGGAVDFGAQPLAGPYYVIASNGAGCTATMSGAVSVVIDPLPAVYPETVTNGGNYCAGFPGQEIDLGVSSTGVKYQLQNPGNVGGAIGGTGGKLNFGVHPAGTYSILATTTATGCQSTMTGPVTITEIPLPTAYTITDAGNYCAGSLVGSDVYLSGSALGVDYKLYKGTALINTVHGTGIAGVLDFGNQLAGSYTAVAVDVTYGCVNNMASTAIVGINPLPVAQTVTGGGHFCFGTSGVPVGLKNSVVGVNYQLYNTGGMIVGADSAGTGSAISFGLQTGADNYTVVATDGHGCTNTMTGAAAVVVDPLVVPSISISAGADTTVCAGATASFTSTISGGGSSPMYSWMVNGTAMSSTGSTFSYKPVTGDVVTAVLTSNATCALPFDTAASNDVMITVNPGVTPTVTIATPNKTVCNGTSVTFTASSTLAGTSPIYEWKKNGAIVGTNSTTYTTVPDDSDVVFCILASNVACNLVPFVLSTPITMIVNTSQAPVFNITANPGNTIAHGTPVTFTAWVSNATGSFTYQWSVNGVAQAGATTGVFVSSTLNDNDQVTCAVTSVNTCGNITGTNEVFMSVSTLGVAQVSANSDVRVIPNPNKGIFTVKGSLGTTADEEVALEITNMLGQVVYSSKAMAHSGNINEQVQLSNTLANGMYLLNLRSGADTKVFHFVIEQ